MTHLRILIIETESQAEHQIIRCLKVLEIVTDVKERATCHVYLQRKDLIQPRKSPRPSTFVPKPTLMVKNGITYPPVPKVREQADAECPAQETCVRKCRCLHRNRTPQSGLRCTHWHYRHKHRPARRRIAAYS